MNAQILQVAILILSVSNVYNYAGVKGRKYTKARRTGMHKKHPHMKSANG